MIDREIAKQICTHEVVHFLLVGESINMMQLILGCPPSNGSMTHY
jgi:hypothetical protein